ncbi:MAG: hypothetical protein AAB212_02080, partial [Bacteroidota bacterium]
TALFPTIGLSSDIALSTIPIKMRIHKTVKRTMARKEAKKVLKKLFIYLFLFYFEMALNQLIIAIGG